MNFTSLISEEIIKMYEIKQDGILQDICTVMVEASPWSLAFDNSYRLWICQPNETNPVVCYNWNTINENVSTKLLQII